ncbi:MAG: amino acid ABC transporter permease [Elusimicrobiota bacterium]|jgi:L-cystine transport system permease protein|nr:amino acid ABC transporter permease [Elusimicrobiota bacterium]
MDFSDLFSFSRLIENMPGVLGGLKITLAIVVSAFVFGSILGFIIAIIRIRHIKILEQITLVYISFMRCTPLVVQLFVVYFGLPLLLDLIGIDINKWDKLFFVIVAYILNEGAFISELIRSSLLAVPSGQSEAAYSIGLNNVQTYVRIIIPQAVRIAIPGLSVQIINLFQGTSLAFLMGILDMMGRAQGISVDTYHALEAYIDVAIIFIAFSIIFERFFMWLNKKYTYTFAKGGY